MTIPLARKVGIKKFMWDGGSYDTQEQAQQTMHDYEKDGFEVLMFEDEGQFLVYSRRVATVQSGE